MNELTTIELILIIEEFLHYSGEYLEQGVKQALTQILEEKKRDYQSDKFISNVIDALCLPK